LPGNLHPACSLTRERRKCDPRCRRDRPDHACRAPRASVVSDTGDRTCLCAHLLARQPTSLTRLLTREVSVKLGAVEIALTTHAARRASAVSDTGDRRCLCAHLPAGQPIHPFNIPYSLTRERSKCEARCLEVVLTTHAARRASVVSNTRGRRCLCAHLLARQPIHIPYSLTRLRTM
jgi:hypothetical protein